MTNYEFRGSTSVICHLAFVMRRSFRRVRLAWLIPGKLRNIAKIRNIYRIAEKTFY